MIRIVSLCAAFLLLLSSTASGQEWIEYANRSDLFAVNFPAQPKIETITWISESETKYPGHVYSYDEGRNHYAITVVDYSDAERLNAERAKTCPPGAQSACSGSITMGVGSWIVDVQGAMAYAIAKFMTREGAKITHFGWFYQDLVEGLQTQITNADGSRTFAATHMHTNRLYVIEATVPRGAPQPGHFQQSLQFLDADGNKVRYETVYSNRYPVPRRSR